MPFEQMTYRSRFSDLVVNEYEPSIGYCRESINVTPPAASAPVLLGTVVFRAKSLDPAAPYAPITGPLDLVDTNEFAVIIGNNYSFQPSYVPNAIQANEFNSVAYKRGPLILKEYYVKAIAQDATGANLSDAEFITLKELLKNQGIVVELTL